jgi:hypothetical protein
MVPYRLLLLLDGDEGWMAAGDSGAAMSGVWANVITVRAETRV